MDDDAETIKVYKSSNDDIFSVIMDLLGCVNYKLLLLIFIIYIAIQSDVFIKRILNGFPGAVYYDTPTSRGTVIQAMFFTAAYVASDVALKSGVL